MNNIRGEIDDIQIDNSMSEIDDDILSDEIGETEARKRELQLHKQKTLIVNKLAYIDEDNEHDDSANLDEDEENQMPEPDKKVRK